MGVNLTELIREFLWLRTDASQQQPRINEGLLSGRGSGALPLNLGAPLSGRLMKLK
jgi:hypothetical protein